MAKKMYQVGQIWSKKDDKGKFYLRLGKKNKNNSQYDLQVEVTVKDANGNVVAKQTDGILTLIDPRKQAEAKGDEKALAGLEKVPDLQFEVLVGVD